MRVSQIAGAAAGLFTAACLLSFVHPFGNPRSIPSQPRETLLRTATMPDETRRVLLTKCADCHSDTTHWPIYSKAAPASWLLDRDVAEGRKHMNLSHWLELSNDQREVLGSEIGQQAKKGSMPPLQYRLVHWGSGLTPTDVAALALLSPKEATDGGASQTGDFVRGKSVFERKCTGCHSLDSDHEGPRLRGVYGRKAGTVPGFGYSTALKSSGVVWDNVTIERWIRDSDAMVPQSSMDFSVPKVQDRADIIAYLRTVK